MSSSPLIPPEQWRHLFRALLRECTYLPDPVARGYMHDYVVRRFRRYSDKSQSKVQDDLHRQHLLRKTATQKLSLLKRANEGYSRPLEKVLRLSYGRSGKKRRELLGVFIVPEVPPDALAVEGILKGPSMFEDDWKPPTIVLDLLKSQLRNAVISQLSDRPVVKTLEPPIPKENSWGKPVAKCRRRNIRKKWYYAVLDSLLPPLPDAELDTLHGLISGRIPWTPPKRRKAVGVPLDSPSQTSLDVTFLTGGPKKGPTFRDFVNGRPHQITRRFMQRLWRRIYCMVPRLEWDEKNQKQYFKWESVKPFPNISTVVKHDQEPDLFQKLISRVLSGIKPLRKKRAAKESQKNVAEKYDVSSIHLDGESDQSVPVWDTCDVVRKKINAHLRDPDVTKAQFLRDIAKAAYPGTDKKLNANVLNDFLSKSGANAGSTIPPLWEMQQVQCSQCEHWKERETIPHESGEAESREPIPCLLDCFMLLAYSGHHSYLLLIDIFFCPYIRDFAHPQLFPL
ncbi:hypothetical protein BA78_0812 [Aspergillus fumigatus]|nr:hypothetical protein BA78_0812 [Aspergillus fumigatus]